MGVGLSPATIRALRWAVFLALIIGVALGFSNVLFSVWEDIKDQPLTLSWQFVLAWLIFGVAVALSGVLWGRILSELEQRPIGALSAASAHCVAWLLKYIPGQVGAFVYKVAWAKKRGFSASNAGLSFLYENLFLQIASLVPGLIILALFAGSFVGDAANVIVSALIAVAAIGVGLLLLGPALRWTMGRLVQRMEATTLKPLSNAAALRHAAWFVLPRLLNACGFVLIVSAITPVQATDWLALGAIYVVAGAIGILAVFVPSGLGVREGVIVVLAAPLIGASSAIVAAVLARLIATAADILVACMALMRGTSRSFLIDKEVA